MRSVFESTLLEKKKRDKVEHLPRHVFRFGNGYDGLLFVENKQRISRRKITSSASAFSDYIKFNLNNDKSCVRRSKTFYNAGENRK